MTPIHFEATPATITDWNIIRLPESASAQLPSRGLVLVDGTLNGIRSKIMLEPDGKGSHWFRVTSDMIHAVGIGAGERVTLDVEPSKEWPEPDLPGDLKEALASDPQANALWVKITPMARWDWLRWIRSTNSFETRRRRIAVAMLKLKAGKRRPCCFNRNLCTEPKVSKNGVLNEPSQLTK